MFPPSCCYTVMRDSILRTRLPTERRGQGRKVTGAPLAQAMHYLGWIQAFLDVAYQRFPILVAALPTLIVLTVLAALLSRERKRGRNGAPLSADRRAANAADSAAEPDAVPPASLPPTQAWLTLDDAVSPAVRLSRPLTRIGRHKDNDVRLADGSVHRYHALIQRTREADFVITDLSGENGNGVRVNGERAEQARLTNGDVIELGRAKLKFECATL